MLLFTLIVMLFIIFLIKVRNIMFGYAGLEKKRSSDEIFKLMEYTKIYDRNHYYKQHFEKLTLISEEGFKLTAQYLKCQKQNSSVIILLHGYSVDHHRSCQYIDFFLTKGFNILLVDQRSHGESEGKYTTYGCYEVKDLNLWVNLMIEKLGYNSIIGIHGHSMGAATALLYSVEGIGKVRFIISEAGYSDAAELLKSKLNKHRIPVFPFYQLTCQKIKSKCGFRIKDICPIDIVKDSSIPILFIHGDIDELVPCKMGTDMYRSKKDPKAIYIVKDGMHNTCYSKDKNIYEEVVSKFINENI
ncbi:MAG: alpha/beta hydrolase [Clostridium sp.]